MFSGTAVRVLDSALQFARTAVILTTNEDGTFAVLYDGKPEEEEEEDCVSRERISALLPFEGGGPSSIGKT
jgi:hypothetical protein